MPLEVRGALRFRLEAGDCECEMWKGIGHRVDFGLRISDCGFGFASYAFGVIVSLCCAVICCKW
jgi:hypothetical protein